MLNFSNREEIYVAANAIDMRKSFDGLSIYIQQNLENNPLTGKWFVFFNKKRDKIKIFYWDGNGPCFWYKRYLGHLEFKIRFIPSIRMN